MVPVILASGSPTRAMLLRNAGVPFSVVAASVDERDVEARLVRRGADRTDIARALAEAKASSVQTIPGALVVGADQTLDLDGRPLHKPTSFDEAAEQIAALSGRTHSLHSAVAVARNGIVLWQHVDSARLTMRQLRADDVAAYLREVGDAALTSVGGYQVEGPGVRLFERIEGSHFTILGLPLLPLLAYLRGEGAVR